MFLESSFSVAGDCDKVQEGMCTSFSNDCGASKWVLEKKELSTAQVKRPWIIAQGHLDISRNSPWVPHQIRFWQPLSAESNAFWTISWACSGYCTAQEQHELYSWDSKFLPSWPACHSMGLLCLWNVQASVMAAIDNLNFRYSIKMKEANFQVFDTTQSYQSFSFKFHTRTLLLTHAARMFARVKSRLEILQRE